MSQHTLIPWAHHTFNIVWGCQRVSPGCEHCYAESLAKRRYPDQQLWGPAKGRATRLTFGDRHWAEPLKWNRQAERAGVRERVFCSSMADVFDDHPTVKAERAKLWPLMRATPHLDWLLLTKRPENIANALPLDWEGERLGYPNVWLGASIESQDYLWRAAELADVRFDGIRFLSCEPLLARLDLTQLADLKHEPRCFRAITVIDWVIVGGESGNGRRPMDLRWAYDIKAQCDRAGVAFFFKQRSDYRPDVTDGVPSDLLVRSFPNPQTVHHG